MAKMHVKKGDTVQVITRQGPRREGQGHRGLPARASASWSRVSTGSRKHTKVGQTARGAKTGGIVTQEAPDPRLQRDAGRRARTARRRHPRRLPRRTTDGATRRPRPLPSAPVRTSDDCTTTASSRKVAAAAQAALPRRDRRPSCVSEFGYEQRHAGPRPDQDRRQHGCRRGRPRLQADRRRRPRPDRDHRPEAAGHQGPQVDRPVQAARGHADRRARHAARRPDVGVPRPPARRSRCPASATSAACRRKQFDGRGNYTFGLTEQVDVPRDRPGQDRPRPRHGHHGRHHGEDRRRGARAAPPLGFPFKEN